MRKFLGILFQLAAIVVALAGLVPAAILLNPWRNALLSNQVDEIYFGYHLTKAGIIALAGFIAAFILFRVARHLKKSEML